MATSYQIIDNQTKQVIGAAHKTRKSAQHKADRLDHRYGAIRFIVRPIWPEN